MPSEKDRRTDVLVIGAGLAGLSTALEIAASGRTVRILEAAEAPGGRMRTDVVDGFRIDRGFQVLNTAYRELRRLDVLDRLDLRRFGRGAFLVSGDRRDRLVDPRQRPSGLLGDLRVPLGSVSQRLRLVAFLAACGYAPASRIRGERDVAFREQLSHWKLLGTPTDRFIRPFLAGVLLESELDTSSRYVDFVWRTFVRGQVVVPAAGMQALPDLLAGRLPEGTIRYGTRVSAVRPGEVDTDHGTVAAAAVVVAADPITAAGWLALTAPDMHAVTTVWHAAPTPPVPDPLIALDADGGPLVNSVILSNTAPGYSPDRRALVATSYLGVRPLPEARLRHEISRLWGRRRQRLGGARPEHHRPRPCPRYRGGSRLRQPVRRPDGLFVAGDWRDTPSTQGALVSGRRAAAAVLRSLV